MQLTLYFRRKQSKLIKRLHHVQRVEGYTSNSKYIYSVTPLVQKGYCLMTNNPMEIAFHFARARAVFGEFVVAMGSKNTKSTGLNKILAFLVFF